MLSVLETTELSGLLHQLDTERKGIDVLLESMEHQPRADELRIQRLKKRQSFIKEEITKIRSIILPDIIA